MELLLPLLLLLLSPLARSSSLQALLEAAAAAGPVLRDRPFVVVWNMPTARCHKHYNIYLDLRDFDIVENSQQDFRGQVIPFTFTHKCTRNISQPSLRVRFILLYFYLKFYC